MSKALSLDLRVRVLVAVHGGATHREAAERFGVSAASVSRWRTRERQQGDARAKALGGDRRSGRIEAHHTAVLAALGLDRDATIEEVRRDLAAQGLIFGFGTIQRFFVRHDITRKKRPRTPRSRIAPMSRSNAKIGSKDNSISNPSA
jgi:transposase